MIIKYVIAVMQHESKFYQIAPSHCNEKESKWTVWTCDMSIVEVHGSSLWILIWERSEEKILLKK